MPGNFFLVGKFKRASNRMVPLFLLFAALFCTNAFPVENPCTQECCTATFGGSDCVTTAWTSPVDHMTCKINGEVFPCDHASVLSPAAAVEVDYCKTGNVTDFMTYSQEATSNCTCLLYLNCSLCAADTNCVWCETNSTAGCVSGGMFGGAGCPGTMDWKYRQCAMSGLWILVICAAIILVILIFILVCLIWACKKKKEAVRGLCVFIGLNQSPDDLLLFRIKSFTYY